MSFGVNIGAPCTVPSAPTAATATPATICNGSSSNLSATSTGNTISWYTASTGGTSIGTSASGANFSVSPTATTTYYAEAVSGSCVSASRTAVTVTVNPLPGISSASANPATICAGGSSSLSATSAGNTINWYTASTSGTSIGSSNSGANFSVTPGGTTTYYAEATTPETNMLGRVAAFGNGCCGTYTQGYAFTPTSDITVTGVLSYYGSKVSVWSTSNTATPLISQPVSGSAGTWTATPLSSPVTLSGGTTYRVGVYTTGPYYQGPNLPASFSGGTIGTAYYTGIDGYPSANDNPVTTNRMVDLQFGGGGCVSASRTPVTVTVNPTPTVAQPGNQTVCAGAATAAVNFTGSVSGTNYSWTNNNPSIGLGASGTGDVPIFTATNTTGSPITGTVTVTPSTGGPATQTFSYKGAMQTWTVPAGVSSITVVAKGASGGGNRGGGNGGTIQSVLSVTPGQVLNIFVGQAGSSSPGISAYNGGGAGGVATGSYNNAGGGGGATDIRIGGTALSNRVLVAGGGGGSGGFAGAGGGAGGGTTGANGGNGQGAGGTGGSQSAGGAGGAGNGDPAGSNGTLGAGGAGGAPSSNAAGGGGGGGYYGGGGGGADYDYCCTDGGGGAGGSSYTSGSVISNVQGNNFGDGQLSISYTTLVCTGSAKTFDITVNPNYAITASAGSNGTISPSSATNVCSGTSQTYTITASTAGSGYHIATITVDGVALSGSAATTAGVGTGSGSYTFSNVTAAHSINATFAANCVAPAISCNNAPITQGTDAGLCTATVNYTPATATGTAPIISYSQNSNTAFSKGVTTVTATANNTCGSDQCTFTVTVSDNEKPVITCAAAVTTTTSTGICTGNVTVPGPTTTDNCSIFLPGAEMVANGDFNNTSVNWDACGNNTEAYAVETSYGGSNSSNHVAEVDPGSSSSTSDDMTLCQTISGFTIGKTYALSFKASRRNGAPATVGANVVINGGALNQTVYRSNTTFAFTAETFTFTATQTTHQLTFTPSSQWGTTTGFIVDDISIKAPPTGTFTNSFTGTGDASGIYPKGVTTITWTAKDEAGNTNTCTQTVTVTDNQPPVAAAQNLTLNLDANGNASITPAQVNNGSYDNCSSLTLTSVVPSTFNCSDVTGVSSAGNAASFSGGYIDVPDDASLNPANTWTLETWFRTTASSTQQGLIEKYDNGSMYGYLLRINGSNKLVAGVVTAGTAGTGTYITGSTTIATNTWYHVAATYNRSGQIKLYVNGLADGFGSATGGGSIPNNASTTTLKIGARGNDAGTRMQGQMDEVRIWNTERTQSDIQSTKDKSLSGTEAGLQAYYRFEEATASTTATDNTPLTTANTGTISGSVTRVTTNPAPVGGTVPVTLTVTDGNNTATATAFVTVKDITAPTVIAKNITAYLDATGHVSITAAQVDNGSSDNCGMTLSLTPSSFSCSKTGNTAGTLNGSLTADNSFTAYISASDNTLGTQIGTGSNLSTAFSLSANTLTPGQDYYLHIVANDWGGPQSLIGDFTVSGNFEFGNGSQSMSTNTTNWNVNATGFGNAYNTPVSYGANGAGPWGTRSGISSGALNIWDPSGNNNDPVTSPSSPTEIVYFSTPIIYNGNVHTVTLKAVDASNNTSSTTAQVTVLDNLLPSITAPGPVFVSGYCNTANAPASAVTLGSPTVSDNCTVASVTNNAPSSYPVGATTVTWTAMDASGNQKTATQTVTITGPATALSAASVVSPLYPMTGQKIQTIFLGYTPASAQTETINVTTTGGTWPFSYAWTMASPCAGVPGTSFTTTVPSYTFAPTMTSYPSPYTCNGNADNLYTFNITVTDNNGCKAVTMKRLNVVNPYTSSAKDSVYVCHKIATRGSLTYQLNKVPASQAATYTNAGDQLGNCTLFTGRTGAQQEEEEEQPTPLTVAGREVQVYPNPSTGTFTVQLSAIENEADIVVTDVQGRMVARRIITKDAPQAKTSFELNDVAKGIYLIQVKDGTLNYRTKIVVQ